MEDLLELEDNDIEVEDGTSPGEPNSTVTPSPSTRQPKINLDELEDFRKFKSEAQKREHQKDLAIQQTQRELQQMQAQLREIHMQGLDEPARLAYERDEYARAYQALQAERQAEREALQWNQLLMGVAAETGVPLEELQENASSLDHAWRLGRKYERENRGKRGSRQDDDEDEYPSRRVDDRVDIGGGKPQGSTARLQAEYDRYQQDGDMLGMFAAEDKAIRAGVKLKHQQ